MTERTRVSLERADIVIVPELDDFSSTDWRRKVLKYRLEQF